MRGNGFVKNFLKKIQELVFYYIFEKYPVTKYAIATVDSAEDTVAIMDACSWVFSPLEVIKLFLIRYIRTAINICNCRVHVVFLR